MLYKFNLNGGYGMQLAFLVERCVFHESQAIQRIHRCLNSHTITVVFTERYVSSYHVAIWHFSPSLWRT